MNKPYKPEFYNSVSPYFIVNGAQKMIDLLKELFNAKEMRRYEIPDGTIMHVEVQIDDSIIMIGDASEQFPANTHMMHVYVQDVEKVFEKALHLNCESISPPNERKDDPDRRGTFKDFAGNIWSVATQL